MDDKALRERLDALEIRVAHQERTIEELNETITAQWKQIDGLARHVTQLVERVAEAEEQAGVPPPERPPHY